MYITELKINNKGDEIMNSQIINFKHYEVVCKNNTYLVFRKEYFFLPRKFILKKNKLKQATKLAKMLDNAFQDGVYSCSDY